NFLTGAGNRELVSLAAFHSRGARLLPRLLRETPRAAIQDSHPHGQLLQTPDPVGNAWVLVPPIEQKRSQAGGSRSFVILGQRVPDGEGLFGGDAQASTGREEALWIRFSGLLDRRNDGRLEMSG